MFRDNAMFEGLPGREQLSGVFDFYFAGVDTLLFDLAVCLNDWCIDLDTGRLIDDRATALRGLKYDYYKGAQSYRACDQQSIQSVFVLESKTKNKRNQYDVFDVVVTEPADEKRLRTCDELGHKS